ncbi:hypothetical protein NLY43_18925 [Mesorhizobium sp. C416B]|uniref:hypothetical protein n=1 Tax=unclassified Mesorhizobium TaxID=325217 RepID=UPI0012EB9840|nr:MULTISPECIES: hypothetical protein [unclassified Mesorhizobium]WJI60696.1 hypothetical protein NLY43_18925 [Mesorhizobium sp. C416B]
MPSPLQNTPDLSTLPPDALLTRKQMSALSGFTEQAFKKWARLCRGPHITVIEGRPRYRVADARAWLGAAQ